MFPFANIGCTFAYTLLYIKGALFLFLLSANGIAYFLLFGSQRDSYLEDFFVVLFRNGNL